jgi:hypothetical protein
MKFIGINDIKNTRVHSDKTIAGQSYIVFNDTDTEEKEHITNPDASKAPAYEHTSIHLYN